MNTSEQYNPIVTGSIWKGMLVYFFPIFLGSMFQQLYNTVDTVIVGRFVGTQALASVGGSAGQIAGIIFWFLGGIANGATVTIAQHYGANDPEGIHRDIHNGVALAIIGSMFLAILGFIFCPQIFRMMETPEELMQGSVTYIRILFCGLTVSFLYNMGSGILRALGDSRRPLIYLIICSFVNIILDLFFVVVIPLGVKGVAIATVLAQLISAVLVLRRIMNLDPAYALRIRKIRIYKDVMKAQLRIGLPGGFQSALYGIANIIIQTSINMLGTSTMAAYAAFGKLDAVYWQVGGSFGTAVTTFSGQNYGAGNLNRVKKSTNFALFADCTFSVIISTILVVFAPVLLHIFTKDTEVIELGNRIMRTVAPFYIFYSFIEILSGSLRGMGDVFVPTVMTLLGICALRILWILFVVPMRPQLETVTIVFAISWIATAVLFIIYFLIAWKKIRKRTGL